MADSLEAYAARLDLPVRLGTTVERLERHGDRWRLSVAGTPLVRVKPISSGLINGMVRDAAYVVGQLSRGHGRSGS
jgi:hypothetical protein